MKPRHNWFWVRIGGITEIIDGLCLLIFGRYWALTLKYYSWELKHHMRKGT